MTIVVSPPCWSFERNPMTDVSLLPEEDRKLVEADGKLGMVPAVAPPPKTGNNAFLLQQGGPTPPDKQEPKPMEDKK